MTERYIDLEAAMQDPELDLITDYLANELPAEQIAAVSRRLEQDQSFRDRWAPLVAAWQARPPLPAVTDEQVQASWARLRARAGLLPAAPKPRRSWIRLLAIVTVTFGALVTLAFLAAFYIEPIGDAWTRRFEYTEVADSGRVMQLADGATVRLAPGARLWVEDRSESAVRRRVKLEGSAFFEVRPLAAGPSGAFVVETRGAHIRTSNADFQVDATADTTQLSAGKPGATAFDRGPATVGQVVYMAAWGSPKTLAALVGDRLLAVRGKGTIPLVRARIETQQTSRSSARTGSAVAPRQPTYTRVIERPGAAPETLAVSYGPVSPPAMATVATIDPTAFAAQAGVSKLAEGIFVQLDSGGRLGAPDSIAPIEPMRTVRLEGSATFVVVPDGPPGDLKGRSLMLMTRGALVVTTGGVVRVATRGDTTECEVQALAPGADSLRPRSTQIAMVGPPSSDMMHLGSLMLVPGMRARIVRGQKPVKIP